MRNDHVFYGHIGGRYPTPEEMDHHIRMAHRMRAEAMHDVFRDALRWLGGAFRWRGGMIRLPVLKTQHC